MNALKPIVIALAALCALGLGVWTATSLRAPPPAFEAGVLLPQPRPIPEFQLTDQDGAAFSRERLKSQWSLLFVGFTHCPDVCPTTLSLMKLLKQRLRTDNRDLQPVFISVDPQRDTTPRLKSYVSYFSPEFIGATGPDAELQRLCAALGLAYIKVPGATEDNYTMDHSAALVLVNPRGEVAGYFQAPFQLDALATDLRKVIPVT